MKFEIVSKYADADLNLPVRKTKASAGYDFQVAEDIVIPSYFKCAQILEGYDKEKTISDGSYWMYHDSKNLSEVSALTKAVACHPTLVPTGIKCEMPEDFYLELSVRSSCPLKHWLILANGVGIIDADYYNNPDNEGHIFFQIINLSPFDIVLKKGDAIGQGIFKKYYLTDDDAATAERQGGFGSTDNVVNALNDIDHPHVLTPNEWLELGTQLFYEDEKAPMEEECVMACNPNRKAFIVGSEKTFTTENHDVDYSCS